MFHVKHLYFKGSDFMGEKNKNRVNAFVSDESYKYIQDSANDLGLSISGFINLCINQYRQQSMALTGMMNFESYITRLEALQEKQENKND